MSAAATDLLSKGYKAKLLTILMMVCALNLTDRLLVPVLAEPIKLDLELSDTQLGLLTGLGFGLVYTALGLPVAWLADRFSRVKIVSAAVIVWSSMTAMTGMAGNFVQLLVLRAGVGVGEAGFLPPTASLLSDHFPANRRGAAMSIVQLGSPASTIIGGILAAWIAAHWGWRTAFVAIGLPGILLGILALTFLREPPRGLVDGITEKAPTKPFWSVIRSLLAKRSFRHLMIGGSLAMLGLNSIGSFMTPFFMRVHGLELAQAGTTFGIVQFVAAVAGLLAGGFGSDRLAAKDIRWRAWGPAIFLALASPFYLLAFSADSVVMSVAFILMAGISFFIFFVPTITITQNLVGAESRATAVALYSLGVNLIGMGIGPTLVGLASDLFAQSDFGTADFIRACPGGVAPDGAVPALGEACASAAAYGLQGALMLVACVYLWAALHYYLVGRSLPQESQAAG
ncbi:spinster family MFS transporter [Parasphingopyxis marina]|uniref:MFS transporter n=1 Tax=Parasphingopyxis marina TaxID=2761622 RepID=A0A842HVU3_9SPHN|nr:MFS transporter [Parasphingopyxis marina]MBC2777025.1 MFS transporter [Parasphingopyxis marina]